MDKFKVGQRVKVTTKDTWAHGLTGDITGIKTRASGEFWGYFVTFDDDTKNNHGDRIFWENEELASGSEETAMEFKVGDRVEVIDANCKIIASNGDLGTVHTVDRAGYIGVDFDNGKQCIAWNLSRFKVIDETMTLKEAMKLCIDGSKVCFAGSRSPKNHMKFDGKNFVYFEHGVYEVAGDALLRQTQWKLWEEPETPPRFKPRQLIRNATGDIGFVVSDEGVKKGVRRYKVCFNAVEDSPLKNYDESMLFEVVL